MNALPDEVRARELKSLGLNHEELPTQRSFFKKDAVTFQVILQDIPFSWQGVLSVASSIYNPIELSAPVINEGKIILCELMAEMRKEPYVPGNIWDRPLPETCLPRWIRWCNSRHHLMNIHIPWCYQPFNMGSVKRRDPMSSLTFTTSSLMPITSRLELLLTIKYNQWERTVTCVPSTSQSKSHTFTRCVELCGAVLATVLAQTVEHEMKSRVTIETLPNDTDVKIVFSESGLHFN